MKRKEFSTITRENAESKLEELKKELVKLRAQSSAGSSMDNPGKIRSVKRSIAQIETMKRNGFGGKAKK